MIYMKILIQQVLLKYYKIITHIYNNNNNKFKDALFFGFRGSVKYFIVMAVEEFIYRGGEASIIWPVYFENCMQLCKRNWKVQVRGVPGMSVSLNGRGFFSFTIF